MMFLLTIVSVSGKVTNSY